MGVPIGKLICASNENKVLYDFFQTGIYNRNREFVLTNSPSMDILVSSNLERLIYWLAGNSANKNVDCMSGLSAKGVYHISEEMREKSSDFYGNFASEEETGDAIKTLFEDTGYIIDTHTAVAASVYQKYKKDTQDTTKTLIVSTASPYKFTRSVMEVIDKEKYQGMGDFELADELSRISAVPIPRAIEEIRNAKVLHDRVCQKDNMKEAIRDILTNK